MHSFEEEMRQFAALENVPILAVTSAEKLIEVVKETKPKRILEIGTAIGYSALLMIKSADASASLTTIEMDPERAALARRFIAKADELRRIEIIEGDAAQILPRLEGRYDFIFIDGPKGQYLRQLKMLLPEKLAEKATVIADNVGFRGMVDGTTPCLPRYRTLVTRLREYIDFVSKNPHFSTQIFASADHLAISYYSKELKNDA